MKILLSPAKTFRKQPLPDVPVGQTPQYMETTEQLRTELKKLTADQWQTQFKLSEKAALENRARMNQPQPAMAALAAFHGEAFRNFQAETLSAEDWRYCEEHQKIITAHYNKHQRDPASKRRYGRAWKRIRDRYIAAHPLCEQCKRAGKITPAEEVHHILPLSKGGTHVESNLMALCKRCHSEITAREGGRWG